MPIHVISLDDVKPQPWRNGGGFTRELLTWPHDEAWRLRVSVADVESDGPFSSFPGVERWFAVVDGNGVELTIDGATRRLTRDVEPLCFDGALPATCRLLDGPTRDLNLMLHGMRGGMFTAVAGRPWRPRAKQCGVFTLVNGMCTFDDTERAVPARTLLWFDDAPASLTFVPTEGETSNVGWWLAASQHDGTA